jgi:hypothetical protein
MNKIFFHNKQDKNSTDILNTLDSTVTVYDVFGKDKDNLPDNIKISYLPYLIDRYISLDTPAPYKAGTFTLDLSCRDYQDNILINESTVFYIYINDNLYNYIPVNGMIHLQINCPIATTLKIKIEADKYLPFETSIGVN